MNIALSAPAEFGQAIPVEAAPEVLRFLARRRSTSAVTLREPAPGDQELADLLRIATRAPDHGKLSPWRFIRLDGAEKAAFADRLEAQARARGDTAAAGKLAKLRVPPMALVVISSPKPGAIPEWEQRLSAGAVCTLLLTAALAMGYGANWITDWYSYDADALRLLGVAGEEKVAGFVLLGTAQEAPLERERPATEPLLTSWRP